MTQHTERIAANQNKRGHKPKFEAEAMTLSRKKTESILSDNQTGYLSVSRQRNNVSPNVVRLPVCFSTTLFADAPIVQLRQTDIQTFMSLSKFKC